MRTTTGFLLVCFLALLIAAGCGDETVTEPEINPSEQYSLTIAGLPEEARASVGVELRLPFTVTTCDGEGVPLSGRAVTAWVDFGPGAIVDSPLNTNTDGVAYATYAVTLLPAQPDRTVVIKVRLGSVVASTSLMLVETARPARLVLSTATPVVFAAEGEPAQIALKVTAVDENGGSVSDVALRCLLQPATEGGEAFGSVTREVVTDAHGEAEITYNSLNEHGQVIVRVEEKYPPAEPAVSGSITLEVRELSQKIGSLEMFLDPDTLTVYGKEDLEIQVMVRVLGEGRQPLARMPVALTAEYSAAAPAPLTDEFGVTQTLWRLNPRRDLPGLPPEGIAVNITCTIPGTDWETQASLFLQSAVYPVGSLTLFVEQRTLLCDGMGGKHLTLTATLRDEKSQYLPERELQVYVSSNHAIADPTVITDNLGRAEILVDDIGSDLIVDGEGVEVTVRQLEMDLEASLLIYLEKFDETVFVQLQADRMVLVAGSGDSMIVRATVLLADGSPAPIGTIVRFECGQGRFVPAAAAVSGPDGSAVTRYYTGWDIETDTLQAWVERLHATYFSNQVLISLTAGPPAVLRLSCGEHSIPRNESTEITARIEDDNGNPTSGVIHFWTDNGDIQPNCRADEDGSARVAFNAGSATGLATVIARVNGRIPGEVYSDTLRLHITGLPPVQMEMDIGLDGTAVGGAAWEIPVTVRISDGEGQPVEDGLPVTFTVNPPLALLQNVVTGNADAVGRCHPGVAHGRLIYQSQFTNEPVTVTAFIQSDHGPVEVSRMMDLPLQRGEIMLNVDPANWQFNADDPEARIRIWAIVRDGHGVPVNGARVLFTTTRSRLSWYNLDRNEYIQYFPDPAIKVTGAIDRENLEEPGTATVYLEAEMDDIYLDPFTLEVRVEINACVVGNDDVISEPRFIIFTRLAG